MALPNAGKAVGATLVGLALGAFIFGFGSAAWKMAVAGAGLYLASHLFGSRTRLRTTRPGAHQGGWEDTWSAHSDR